MNSILANLDSDLQGPKPDLTEIVTNSGITLTYLEGEFWTSKQRDAHSLHEVSYRACFKPQLPSYFIRRFTSAGDCVYDPFGGRGTTALESALLGRIPCQNDVNPLSTILAKPRLNPPTLLEVEDRLKKIPQNGSVDASWDLGMFYHGDTLREIAGMREYFLQRESDGKLDSIDDWIRMVAVSRLSGHSPGFFSVYSMPPNQSVTRESQERINSKRGQTPTYRDTHSLILKKTDSLTKDLSANHKDILNSVVNVARFYNEDSRSTPHIGAESVKLVVTSPPFLDVVNYAEDNWLRSWFAGVENEGADIAITTPKDIGEWKLFIKETLLELRRVISDDGLIAFEVGEVRKGKVLLEQVVAEAAVEVGLNPHGVLVNIQSFTKTSNIWGVSNNVGGTNSNRIVMMSR